MKLKDQIAIVTGAGRGIGRGIGLRLAREGAHVALTAMHTENVERVLQEMGPIDILVNNAGILAITPAVHISEEEWDRVLDVNLKGTFLCSKHVTREMLKRKKAKIINIASNAGKRGDRFLAHYCASKFGIIGLTQVFAKELGPHNIHVNAVCPGFIEHGQSVNLCGGVTPY